MDTTHLVSRIPFTPTLKILFMSILVLQSYASVFWTTTKPSGQA